MNLNASIFIMRALANQHRFKVYQTIVHAGQLTVSQIVRRTGFKQPEVSHCLSHLTRVGLITRDKVAQRIYSQATWSISYVLQKFSNIYRRRRRE